MHNLPDLIAQNPRDQAVRNSAQNLAHETQEKQLQTKQAQEKLQKRKGRILLLGLIVFFTIPVILVFMLIQFDWRPSKIEVNGQLITPPKLIALGADWQTSDAKPISASYWQDHWTMLYVTTNCAKPCAARLKDMRQLHVSLAKDSMRVQRLILTSELDVSNIKNSYTEMTIVHQPAAEIEKLIAGLSTNHQNQAGFMLMVDPFGHAMMLYDNKVEATNIRKDIMRLLKFAWAA